MRQSTIDLSNEEMIHWGVVAGFSFPRMAPTSHEEWLPVGEAMLALVRLLLARDAIPPIRWRYFSDPDLHGSGVHRSWELIFNRSRGEGYFDHPNFHKFVIYFVAGPNITQFEKVEFREIARQFCISNYQEATKKLRNIVRQKVRAGDERDLQEEYYKQAIETNVNLRDALSLRKIAGDAARYAKRLP